MLAEKPDESAFWLELVREGEVIADPKLESLCDEAVELTAIMASSRITASHNRSR